MIKEISASKFAGTLELPGSKSVAQRAIAAATLAIGESEIFNPGKSKDVASALFLSRACGSKVTRGESIKIQGRGMFPVEDLNAGESGLASRMFLPLFALSDRTVNMYGEGSLLFRPFHVLDQVLPSLGVECKSNNGKLPYKIKGPMHGGDIVMDGSTSSQFATGLLMALPLCAEDSVLTLVNATSKPYLQMTLDVLREFNVHIEHESLDRFFISGNQVYKPTQIHVPGDWSAAANLMVLGALTSDDGIEFQNPGDVYKQSDDFVKDVVMSAGVNIKMDSQKVRVFKSTIRAFECDLSNSPDLFPPLAVLACFADGPCRLKGSQRLILKESNRAMTIIDEFAKAGIEVREEDDELIVYPSLPQNTIMDARNDHRIAMAAAIMGAASNGMRIRDAESVDKSFPDFFEKLEDLDLNNK